MAASKTKEELSAILENQTAFGCIITRNRLAWARTLVQSIRKFHPSTPCFALLVDGAEGYFEPSEEVFEILELSSLAAEQMADLRFKYTAFELCCAAKPFLLRYLLKDRGFSSAIYFDVDILILNSLDALLQRFQHSDVLLTPHILSDLPSDGKRPDDAHVMKSGIFNAGFVGVKRSGNGNAFLEWWWRKCADNCVVDHFNGFFVDQKYLDLAISQFPGMDLVDDPGCNVAYWNLHERSVERRSEGWFVNGKPLLFFHFSDYRFNDAETLSRHQDRYTLKSMPDLEALFEQFCERILANGEQQCRQWPYGFGTYRNGRRIADRTRRAFRLAPASMRPADPFHSASHPLSLRLSSWLQGLTWVVQKLVGRLITRRQVRVEAND